MGEAALSKTTKDVVGFWRQTVQGMLKVCSATGIIMFCGNSLNQPLFITNNYRLESVSPKTTCPDADIRESTMNSTIL